MCIRDRDDLVFFGGRQDEDGVCGRLLERLEEGVEGGRREHVDLVDDEDQVRKQTNDELEFKQLITFTDVND